MRNSPLTGPGPVAAALLTTTALLMTMALGTYIRLSPASSVVNRKLISTTRPSKVVTAMRSLCLNGL